MLPSMPTPLLIDNDVVIKLSQYGLLDQLLPAVGAEAESTFVLEELRYVAKLHKPEEAEKFFGSAEAYKMALDFYNECSFAEIESTEIVNLILSLDRPNLDQGEQVLLGCLMEKENSKMFTGDKRAIGAIDKLEKDGLVTLGVHRILILEVAIRRLIGYLGFEEVSLRIRAQPDVDTAICLCFGRSSPSNAETVSAGLASYIDNLTAKHGELIYSP